MKPFATLLRIQLVDDHAVVRVGLRNLIDDEPDLRVVAEVGSCREALEAAERVRPDVIILDLRLPDGSGAGIIARLKLVAPKVRILVLTSFAEDSMLISALRAGADGYLLKDVGESNLIEEIRRVATVGAVMPQPTAMPRRSGSSGEEGEFRPTVELLTGQEKRVFELVGRGHSNREVASSIGLSEKTVRNYLTRIYEKLGIRRRAELVTIFLMGQTMGARDRSGPTA